LSQIEQSETLTEPNEVVVDRMHSLQADAPFTFEYLPLEQIEQIFAPSPEYIPNAQSTQTEEL
jgi:hypothetical protein